MDEGQYPRNQDIGLYSCQTVHPYSTFPVHWIPLTLQQQHTLICEKKLPILHRYTLHVKIVFQHLFATCILIRPLNELFRLATNHPVR